MAMKFTGAGTFGFTVKPTGAPSSVFTQTVLQGAVQATQGVAWTITLAAWSPLAGAGQGSAGGTPRVVVTYGGGGEGGGGTGRETFTADYPVGGTAFTVHGTNVKVDVTYTMPGVGDSTTQPTLSGWLSAGRTTDAPQVATLTTPVRVVPDATGVTENVPARAIAWRLLYLSGKQIGTLALSGDATPVNLNQEFPIDPAGGAAPNIGFFVPSSRVAWFSLDPRTASLVHSNNSGGAIVAQFATQWLLKT